MKTYQVHYTEQYSNDYLVNANDASEAKEVLCEAICNGLHGAEECDGIAATAEPIEETLWDEEVDATINDGLWTNGTKASASVLDTLPNDLTKKHYAVAIYDTYSDAISIVSKIVDEKKTAVELLKEQILTALVNDAGLSRKEAEETLKKAMHADVGRVCEYDASTNTAKVHYSAAGDETMTLQVIEL